MESNRNIPWALHPHSQQRNTDIPELSSSPKSEYPPLTKANFKRLPHLIGMSILTITGIAIEDTPSMKHIQIILMIKLLGNGKGILQDLLNDWYFS